MTVKLVCEYCDSYVDVDEQDTCPYCLAPMGVAIEAERARIAAEQEAAAQAAAAQAEAERAEAEAQRAAQAKSENKQLIAGVLNTAVASIFGGKKQSSSIPANLGWYGAKNSYTAPQPYYQRQQTIYPMGVPALSPVKQHNSHNTGSLFSKPKPVQVTVTRPSSTVKQVTRQVNDVSRMVSKVQRTLPSNRGAIGSVRNAVKVARKFM
ncbi:MAG: hypothetical protein IJH83_05925 [Coriobacteriales bacterium]|nr:hypothetical protein [Coriobacteriales bacterium]